MARWRWLFPITLAAICLAPPPSLAAQESSPDKLLLRAADHVLVWSQTEGATENIFRKLGFNVRPGQEYPEGIGSSTIAFEDWSYVELVRFTDPSRAAGNAQALTELQFVRQGPGANSFAVQVSDAAEAAAHLKKKGFAVADIVPDMVDPDGPNGPMPPKVASWRDFHFSAPTISGAEIFFIEYPPDPPAAEGAGQPPDARTTHRNSARRLSAIWVLVEDLEKEAEIYGRIGFSVGAAVPLDLINGRIRKATLGEGAVVLVETDRLPDDFILPNRPGPRVIGLTFEVSSLAKVETAGLNDAKWQAYLGPFGPSRLVQLTQSVGLFVEFHEPPEK
jgi:hypothetical protein